MVSWVPACLAALSLSAADPAAPPTNAVAICGNGKVDIGWQMACPPCGPTHPCPCGWSLSRPLEECDGTDIPRTCRQDGYLGGAMGCTRDCKLDRSRCWLAEPPLKVRSSSSGLSMLSSVALVAPVPGRPELIGWREKAAVLARFDAGGETLFRWGFELGPSSGRMDLINQFRPAPWFGRTREGWLGALLRHGQLFSTWVASKDGGALRGPVEDLGCCVTFFVPDERGDAVLAGLEQDIAFSSSDAAERTASLQLAVIRSDGHLAQQPMPFSKPRHVHAELPGTGIPSGAIAAGDGFLIFAASPQAPGGPDGPLELGFAGLDARPTMAASVQAGWSAVWLRSPPSFALVFTNSRGTFAVQVDPRTVRAGSPLRVGPPSRRVWDATQLREVVDVLAEDDAGHLHAFRARWGSLDVTDRIVFQAPGAKVVKAAWVGQEVAVAWGQARTTVEQVSWIGPMTAP